MISKVLNVGHSIYLYVNCKRDGWLLGIVTVSTVASGLVPAAVSILTGRVFDLLNEAAQLPHPMHELTERTMLILGVAACCLVVTWCCISSWMLLGERQNFDARNRLTNSYLRKSLEWYDANDSVAGDLTQINRCVEELRSASAEASALTWKSVVTILSLLITSFYYSWSLTLITLCSSPVIIICAVFFSQMIHMYSERENTHSARSSQLLSWSMEAAQLVRLSCTQLVEIHNFEDSVRLCSDNFTKACLHASTNAAILKFLTLTMFIQSFWFGATMIRKGKLTIKEVITCFQSCVMLGATINGSLQQFVVLLKGKLGATKISTFLAADNRLNDLNESNRSSLTNVTEGIEFRGVQFNYPTRPTVPALKNVSLKFLVGDITYVIGKSGSGKSSLGNLLLKLYNNYNGEICIDGTSIKSIDQKSIVENITLVEQRCTLFNDTLKNNILLGCKEMNEATKSERLKAACRIALLDTFIYDSPNGLDTIIGTAGINPSGGQQQRIAIARAYMRDPPVLVLDEAVSALDVVHRSLLMNAIRTWRADKTTIVLTHDLSEINPEDKVYLLEDGEVVERGLQRELLLDTESRFFNMTNMGIANDSIDMYSQITTVDAQVGKNGSSYEDSIIEYEVETPKFEEECSSLVEISSIPLEDLSFRQKNRSKTPRVIVQEEYSEKEGNGDEQAGKKKKEELMSISDIMKRMHKDKKKKAVLYIGILCSLYTGVSNPVFSYTFSNLLNGIVSNGNSDNGSPGYLLKWAFIVMGVAAADSALNFLKEFMLGYYSETYIRKLRNDTMYKITFNKLDWFSKDTSKPCELSALIMNDLRDLRTLTSKFITAMCSFVIVSSVGLVWALASGWKLSLVCISMFPLMIIFCTIYGILSKKYETGYKDTIANLENLQSEMVSGMKTIRCLELETYFMERYRGLERKSMSMGYRRAITNGFGVAVSSALTMVIQGILYFYAIKLVIIGEYTSKRMFETFTLLLFTIMTCSNLINQIPDLRRGQRAASKIYRTLDETEASENHINEGCRESPIVDNPFKPIVCFKDFSFGYPSAPTVKIFKRMNLDMYSGDTIAIVGESGCGKSTLINLITRLYESPSDSLFVDHTDVNDWASSSLRRQISVVEQKPTLFKGTIRQNLIYGISTDLTDVEVFDMLKYVGIYDFIATLPEGLETKIDSGSLSGGQNQRLCIARALLKKPKILILDECTSALDAVSSHIINEIVRIGPPTMLTISITHDEQMVRSCNKVAVLKHGHVIEVGEPMELLKQRSQLLKVFTKVESRALRT